MSATGLGVTLYDKWVRIPTAYPQDAATTDPPRSECLMYLAAENYTITHVVLANHRSNGSTYLVRLAKTFGGVVTDTGYTGAGGVTEPIQEWSVDAGQTIDWATRIPLLKGWGLIGMYNGPAFSHFYAAITGERGGEVGGIP